MTIEEPLYKGCSRGSQWNKWDLHVHTPASVVQRYGDSQNEDIWEKYISALEALPKEIKAIGINDYFILDGYRRVLKAKNAGRLGNIELILPVVEFRLKQLAGHRQLQRVNYHVIFSNDLPADVIETRFLNKLGITFNLEDGKEHTVKGCDHASLIDLGEAIIRSTPKDKLTNDSSLKVGFSNAVFSIEDIQDLCKQSVFERRIMTALGITEWDSMRFDGGGTGIKRSLINSTDLVFIASPNIESYENRRTQLTAAEVNNRLLDCSDSHNFAESEQSMRLGNVLSWLKADLTFEGLRRAILCFDERVCVTEMGMVPTKLSTVRNQKGKFIDKIAIKKKDGSGLDEKWFDCEVPLNSDLVAIIGNQGGGKSALTDIIALCGDTKTTDFSFLSPDKFRDRDRKASEFEATIYWCDGTSKSRILDEDVSETESQRVRYVPQHFFEVITNETAVKQDGRFYNEIKSVVFSHIDESERMRCSDFDSLVDLRTQEIERSLVVARQELSDLNEEILDVERACSYGSVEKLKNQIETKKQEIIAHKSAKPSPVDKPSESDDVNKTVESLRTQEGELEEKLEKLRIQSAVLKQSRMIVEQKRQAVENEQHRVQKFIDNLQKTFDENEITLNANDVISVSINLDLFDAEKGRISDALENVQGDLDEENPESTAYKKHSILEKRKKLQTELTENNKVYQLYLTNKHKWEKRVADLEGDVESVNSLAWLEQMLHVVTEDLPKKLDGLYQDRREKTRGIHSHLWQLASVYEELTQDVRNFINSDELTRERYQLQFTIQLTEEGFADRIFDMIKYRSSFAGREDGRKRMDDLIKERDFSSDEDTVEFVDAVMSRLQGDYRYDPPKPDDVSDMMRANYPVSALYNYLYGLEYLSPQYSMMLNGKPLRKLSPGERGVLLLVFYLVIDQGDEPLIIDQPEGNLNNQAIYDHLVPVFKKAKNRRQLIIVTHNPNLAVVSDAEQIIYAHIDSTDANKVYFHSGAIENPMFKVLTVDVLEGTANAFNARHQTYDEILRV